MFHLWEEICGMKMIQKMSLITFSKKKNNWIFFVSFLHGNFLSLRQNFETQCKVLKHYYCASWKNMLPDRITNTRVKNMVWACEDGIPWPEETWKAGRSCLKICFKDTDSTKFKTDPVAAHNARPSCLNRINPPKVNATTHLLCHSKNYMYQNQS